MRCRAVVDFSAKVASFLVSQQCTFSTQRKRKPSKHKNRYNQDQGKAFSSCSSGTSNAEELSPVNPAVDVLSMHASGSSHWKERKDARGGKQFSGIKDEVQDKHRNCEASSVCKGTSEWRHSADSIVDQCTSTPSSSHPNSNASPDNKKDLQAGKGGLDRERSSSRFSSAHRSMMNTAESKKSAPTSSSPFAPLIQKHRIMRKNHSALAFDIAVFNSFSNLCMTLARDNETFFLRLLHSIFGAGLSSTKRGNAFGAHPLSLCIWGGLPRDVYGRMPSEECVGEEEGKDRIDVVSNPSLSSSGSLANENLPQVLYMKFPTGLENLFPSTFELPFPAGVQEELMKIVGMPLEKNITERRSSDSGSISHMVDLLDSQLLSIQDGRWHQEWMCCRRNESPFVSEENGETDRKGPLGLRHSTPPQCTTPLHNKESTKMEGPAFPKSSSIFFTIEQCAVLEEAFGFPPVSKMQHQTASSVKTVGSPEWQRAGELQRQVVQEMFWLLKTISFFRWVKEEYRCRHFTLLQGEDAAWDEGSQSRVAKEEQTEEGARQAEEVEKEKEDTHSAVKANSTGTPPSFQVCLMRLHSYLKKHDAGGRGRSGAPAGASSSTREDMEKYWWLKLREDADNDELMQTIWKYLYPAAQDGLSTKRKEDRNALQQKTETEEGATSTKRSPTGTRDIHILDLLYHLLYRYAISNFLFLGPKDRGLCFRMSLLPSPSLPLGPQFSYSLACWYAVSEYEGLYALAWKIVDEGKKNGAEEASTLTGDIMRSLYSTSLKGSLSSSPFAFPLESVAIDFSTFSSEMRIFANACSQGLSEDVFLIDVVESVLKEYRKRSGSSISNNSSTSKSVDSSESYPKEVILANEATIMDFQRLLLLLPSRKGDASSPYLSSIPYYFFSSLWLKYFHHIFGSLLRHPFLWETAKCLEVRSTSREESKGATATTMMAPVKTPPCDPIPEAESKILSPLLDAFHMEHMYCKARREMVTRTLTFSSDPSSNFHNMDRPCWCPAPHETFFSPSESQRSLLHRQDRRFPLGKGAGGKAEYSPKGVVEEEQHLASLALLASRTMMELRWVGDVCRPSLGSLSSATSNSKEKPSFQHPNERPHGPIFSSSISRLFSAMRWVGVQPYAVPFCWSGVLLTVHTEITPLFVAHSQNGMETSLKCVFESSVTEGGGVQLQKWKEKVIPLMRTGAFSLSTYLGRVVLRSVLNDVAALPKRWEECVMKKERENFNGMAPLLSERVSAAEEKKSQNVHHAFEQDKQVQEFLLDVMDLAVCASILCLVNCPEEKIQPSSSSVGVGCPHDGSSTAGAPSASVFNPANVSSDLSSWISHHQPPSPSLQREPQTKDKAGLPVEQRSSASVRREQEHQETFRDLSFRPLSHEFYKKLTAKLAASFASTVQKLCSESWAAPNGRIYSLQQGVCAGKWLSCLIERLSLCCDRVDSTMDTAPSPSPCFPCSSLVDATGTVQVISSSAEDKVRSLSLYRCLSTLHQHIFTERIRREVLQPFFKFQGDVLQRAAPVFLPTLPYRETLRTKVHHQGEKLHVLSDPSSILPQWAVLLARDELVEENGHRNDAKEGNGFCEQLRWTVLKEGLTSLIQQRWKQLAGIVSVTSSRNPCNVSDNEIDVEESASSGYANDAKLLSFTCSSTTSRASSISEFVRSVGCPILSKEEMCVILRILSRVRARQGTVLMKTKQSMAGNYGTSSYSIFDMMSEGLQNEQKRGPPSEVGPRSRAEACALAAVGEVGGAISLADIVLVLQSCLDGYLPHLPRSSQLDAVFIGLLDVMKLPCDHAQEVLHEEAKKTQDGKVAFSIPGREWSTTSEKNKGEGEDEEERCCMNWPVDVRFHKFNSFVASTVLMRHAPFLFARSGGWKHSETFFRSGERKLLRKGVGADDAHSDHPFHSYYLEQHYPVSVDLLLQVSETLQGVLKCVVSSILREVGEEQKAYKSIVCSPSADAVNKTRGSKKDDDSSPACPSSCSSSSPIKNNSNDDSGRNHPSTESFSQNVFPSSTSGQYSVSSSFPYGMLQCYCLTSYLYILVKRFPSGCSSILCRSSGTSFVDSSSSQGSEPEGKLHVPSLYSVLYAALLHSACKVVHKNHMQRIFADELLWCLAFCARTTQEEILLMERQVVESEDGTVQRKRWWRLPRHSLIPTMETTMLSTAEQEAYATGGHSFTPEWRVNASLCEMAAGTANEEEEDEEDRDALDTADFHSLALVLSRLPDLADVSLPDLSMRNESTNEIFRIDEAHESQPLHETKPQEKENGSQKDSTSPLYQCQLVNGFYWPKIWPLLYSELRGVIEACSARGNVKMATNIIFGFHALRSSQAPFVKEKEFPCDSILHRAAGMTSAYTIPTAANAHSLYHQDPTAKEFAMRGNESGDGYRSMDRKLTSHVPSICSLAAASTMLPVCTRSCTLIAQQIRSTPAAFSLTEIKRFLLVLRNWGQKVHDMDYQYRSPPSHPIDAGGTTGDTLPSDYPSLHSLGGHSFSFPLSLKEGQKAVRIRGTITHNTPAPQIRAAWAALSRRLWNEEVPRFVGETSNYITNGTVRKVEETAIGEVVSLALHTGAVLQCSDTLLFRQLFSFLLYGDYSQDVRNLSTKNSLAQHPILLQPQKPMSKITPAFQLSPRLLSVWTTMVEACALAVEDRQEYAILLREMLISRLQDGVSLDLEEAPQSLTLSATIAAYRSPSLPIPTSVKYLSMLLEALGKICIADVELWERLEKLVKDLWCVQLEESLTKELAARSRESLLQSLSWGRKTAGFL